MTFQFYNGIRRGNSYVLLLLFSINAVHRRLMSYIIVFATVLISIYLLIVEIQLAYSSDCLRVKPKLTFFQLIPLWRKSGNSSTTTSPFLSGIFTFCCVLAVFGIIWFVSGADDFLCQQFGIYTAYMRLLLTFGFAVWTRKRGSNCALYHQKRSSLFFDISTRWITIVKRRHKNYVYV